MKVSDFTDATVDAFCSASAFATNLVQPTIRLGGTGLARPGNTVFITTLDHNFSMASKRAKIGSDGSAFVSSRLRSLLPG